jgi:iron complex transport system substrate-binding protein
VAATHFPVTVSVGGRDVEIPARPERIASLSATHTEVLFALGAGDQVIAVDVFSTSPPEAAEKEQIDAFELNVEAVAALEPDLAILAFDPGDAVAGFEALDIPVLLFDAPTDLDGAYSQWEVLGAATGRVAEAASLVEETSTSIDRSVGEVPEMAHPVTYYYELDPTLYTATSETFVGSLFSGFGMENIADPADPDGSGYPRLSPEVVIDADPDLIYLADTQCCQQDAAAVAARPGWDTLGAVERGDIVELPDDVASRWGPSVVELAEMIASSLERHLEPAA